MSIETAVIERLRQCLTDEPDVVVAYLYGSHATGRPGPHSDVDVALLVDGVSEQRRLELIALVADVVAPRRADVVMLTDAPVTLAYRIVRDGILLVERDRRARVVHWVRTVDRYLDMAPAREMLAVGTRNRLVEGRFGRP